MSGVSSSAGTPCNPHTYMELPVTHSVFSHPPSPSVCCRCAKQVLEPTAWVQLQALPLPSSRKVCYILTAQFPLL